jgi:hypothetical protein
MATNVGSIDTQWIGNRLVDCNKTKGQVCCYQLLKYANRLCYKYKRRNKRRNSLINNTHNAIILDIIYIRSDIYD